MNSRETYLERMAAARELVKEVRATGYKLAMDIGTGAVYLWHGTSINSANKILASRKFHADSYFSHARNYSAFGSSGAKDYAFIRGGRGGGVVMRIKVDPRDVSFSNGTGEFSNDQELIQGDDGVWATREHTVIYGYRNPMTNFEKEARRTYGITKKLRPYQGSFILPNGDLLDLDDYGHRGLGTYDFCVKTGAIRIRVAAYELNIAFVKGMKPTDKQLMRIDQLAKQRQNVHIDTIDPVTEGIVPNENNPKLVFDPDQINSKWDSSTDTITIGTKPGGGPEQKKEDIPQILGHEIGHHQLGHKNHKAWEYNATLAFNDEIKAWDWILTKSKTRGYNPELVFRSLETYADEWNYFEGREKINQKIFNLLRKHYGKKIADTIVPESRRNNPESK